MKRRRYVWAVVGCIVILGIVVAAAYFSIPKGNSTQPHPDAILVLGYPSNPDGTPSPEQRERVLEAIREYRAQQQSQGFAPALILTGGAAHNSFVEAHTMGDLARANGIPPGSIFEEGRARNTIENAGYSQRILAAHDWHNIEIVSSPSHLRRASLIFSRLATSYPPNPYPLQWRTHASPWPREYTLFHIAVVWLREITYTARLRVFGFPPNIFLHQKPRKGYDIPISPS